MDHELTHEERLAIAALKRLAKRWPQSLWLFSAGSSLHVMRQPEDGKRHGSGVRGEQMDQELSITTIEGIPHEGGDW